jgi:hypothetical protein
MIVPATQFARKCLPNCRFCSRQPVDDEIAMMELEAFLKTRIEAVEHGKVVNASTDSIFAETHHRQCDVLKMHSFDVILRENGANL